MKNRQKTRVCDARVLETYFDRLWPICRSITGEGYRRSLDILSELVPTERIHFKTGEKVFDWTVPNEWTIRDAFITAPDGKKICDFKKSNLHVLNYSAPFRETLTLEELQKHLYSLPEQPDAVPYLTSYYQERWGFCISDRERRSLARGNYKVVVDSDLKPGRVEIGEAVLKGATEQEVLFSTYLCHPSLANNELSGPLVMAALYSRIAQMRDRRFTYRFAVMPETIGSVCYLKKRGAHFKKSLIAGFQMTCVGDPGRFTYKESRKGDTLADRSARIVLGELGDHEVLRFDPSMGSDERQYCSPGFDLPVGSLMRTMYARYSQYHTSLDNKDFIRFGSMIGSADAYARIAEVIEKNHVWKNTVATCEPQLGKRGLYPTLGSQISVNEKVAAMMWLLNLADGAHDLIAIAQRSGKPFGQLAEIAEELHAKGVLARHPVRGASKRKGKK